MDFLKEKTQKKLKELVSDPDFDEMFDNLRLYSLKDCDLNIISKLTGIFISELNINPEDKHKVSYLLKLAYSARKIDD